jgi:hypothetical protein
LVALGGGQPVHPEPLQDPPPVLLGDGIRLYDAPGGEPVHLQRADADPTQTVSVRYYPPGRDDQREVAP